MTLLDKSLIFGERSLTLIGAEFPDQATARRAQDMLDSEPMLHGEVALVGPDDPQADKKFEPEQAGIWKTLLRSHAVFMLLGLALGIAAALALIAAGWTPAALSPGYALLFIGVFGTFVGGLVAGLVTLRPDHGLVIRQMRKALKKRHWAVVVRPLSEARAELAMERLRGVGAEPLRSL